jgi:cell division protein FtsA
MVAGVVLTGGASKVEGAVELAERIFKMPVRVGAPHHITGLTNIVNNPIYATGVGLLLYGMQQRDSQRDGLNSPSIKSLWGRMKGWFQGNF